MSDRFQLSVKKSFLTIQIALQILHKWNHSCVLHWSDSNLWVQINFHAYQLGNLELVIEFLWSPFSPAHPTSHGSYAGQIRMRVMGLNWTVMVLLDVVIFLKSWWSQWLPSDKRGSSLGSNSSTHWTPSTAITVSGVCLVTSDRPLRNLWKSLNPHLLGKKTGA